MQQRMQLKCSNTVMTVESKSHVGCEKLTILHSDTLSNIRFGYVLYAQRVTGTFDFSFLLRLQVAADKSLSLIHI